MPILSQGFHKGDADNFFAYQVILLVHAVKLATFYAVGEINSSHFWQHGGKKSPLFYSLVPLFFFLKAS